MSRQTRHSSGLQHQQPQPHTHPRDHHTHAGGLLAGLASAFHLPGHSHAHGLHGQRDALFTNRLGTRTLGWSLGLLMATTVIQIIIYRASGSVALLADTLHNLGDALNSVPLLIAFWLARRPATKRYTYGFARAEDLGGLFVVVSIVGSAIYILWEVGQKFLYPAPIQNSGWVILAALVGFLGNEAVAWIEIRVGKQIGSEAMVVDGRHARIDGLTSLAVLPAVAGSLFGLPILDPIFGILIGITILFITWQATISIWYRLMDAVDPGLTGLAREVISAVAAVEDVRTLRLRWVGHSLWIEGQLKMDRSLTVTEVENLMQTINNRLEEQIPNLGEVILSIA